MRGSGRLSPGVAGAWSHAPDRLPQVGQARPACGRPRHLGAASRPRTYHTLVLFPSGASGPRGVLPCGSLNLRGHRSFTSATTCDQDRERQRTRFGRDIGQWPRRVPGQSSGKATVFRNHVRVSSKQTNHPANWLPRREVFLLSLPKRKWVTFAFSVTNDAAPSPGGLSAGPGAQVLRMEAHSRAGPRRLCISITFRSRKEANPVPITRPLHTHISSSVTLRNASMSRRDVSGISLKKLARGSTEVHSLLMSRGRN